MRWWCLGVMAAVLVTATPQAVRADDFAQQEAERLRADLEGESERLRLTLETFMQEQQALLDRRLAEQDRRLARQEHLLWGLGGVCLGLGALSWRLRRRERRSGSR